MKKHFYKRFIGLSLMLFCVPAFFQTIKAQKKMDGIERDRMKTILSNIKTEIKKNYYDPKYHDIDIEARFAQAEARLKEVEVTGQALGVIAQVLMDFNDSHLYFLPPATNLEVEYGWRMQMFGDKGYITTVKPKSDADVKGLKIGDQVLSVENFRPSKSELWKMLYYYNALSKRGKLTLTVLSPGEEKPRQLEINSEIKKLPMVITKELIFTLFETGNEPALDRHLFYKAGGITLWKMPTFAFDPKDVDLLVGKIKESQSLILDLRGNGGGYVKTLERLAGYMFDKDLKIADLKGRKPMDPQMSKTRGADGYKGKLIVLIDARSGSAAEIFARLVQLEKRGTVIGDVSAGAVMQAFSFGGSLSNDSVFYGASITDADVIMSDGKSLEHIGVIPDELLLPTGEDLAKQKDPVLAKAFQMLGNNMTPEQAGGFFQYKWKNDRLTIDSK